MEIRTGGLEARIARVGDLYRRVYCLVHRQKRLALVLAMGLLSSELDSKLDSKRQVRQRLAVRTDSFLPEMELELVPGTGS